MRVVPVCVFLLCLSAAAFSADPPASHKVILIVGTDDMVSAYDAADFHLLMKSRAPLPPAARSHHGDISSINQSGLVLYFDMNHQSHLWNLRNASEVALPAVASTNEGTTGKGTVTGKTYAAPQIAFSADGQRLFWFQNRMSVLQREGEGEISRIGEFHSWTTDIDGSRARPLAHIALPQCKCDTGACEETCPEIGAWAPASGVGDFFYLSTFIPGQLSEQNLETDLYQVVKDTWTVSKLPSPDSNFLDARDNGNTFVSRIPDAGCCGWENESDDMAVLIRKGRRATIFDEWARFQNQDYDVSFFPFNARFSPDGTEIAYTIAATSEAGQTIRLADQGKTNTEELRQINSALVKLPQVELVASDELSKPRFSLTNTQLIGWPDAHHLLVWKSAELFLVDTTKGQLTTTGLKAENAADVFLE